MPPRPRRRRLRRALLAVVLGALAVAAAWTAVVLLQARGDLVAARAALVAARDDPDLDALAPVLAQAQERLDRSADRLAQPGPRLVAALPLVGRTPTAVREAAAAGRDVVAATAGVLEAVPEDLLTGGRVDLAGLARLEQATREAATTTERGRDRLERLRTGTTPGQVVDGVRELQAELRSAAEGYRRTSEALTALPGVLGAQGERRLLVVLQNNAELRGTGGLVSVFAQATARDGVLRLAPFQDVAQVADPVEAVRPVPTPPDYAALYGRFKAGTTLWTNANMSPDVPTSSAVLAQVAGLTLPQRPDAVIWLDVPLVSAVLRALGPVDLPDGTELNAGNAVERLLSQAYSDAPDDPAGQQQRREDLRAAADSVLDRLLTGRGTAGAGTTAELAQELASAATGRHLALWSARPREQQALERAGAAGAVRAGDGDLASFTVHNLGDGVADGNKLDLYARRQTTVEVEVAADAAVVEQRVALRNTAPTRGLPGYVAGRAMPSTSNSFVTLALPARAELLEFSREGRPVSTPVLAEADHRVVTDVAVLMPGSTTSWVLRYRLPLEDGRYATSLVPQPLAVDGGLSIEVRAADGLRLRSTRGPLLERGAVRLSGPFEAVTDVAVVAERPPLPTRVREAVSRFWREPVRLP